MKKTIVSIIAAIGKNRELGKDNKLLWHISADLKRFKELTTGHPVIMGRKTFDSIGKPLPNRLNIILTHDKEAFGMKYSNYIQQSEGDSKTRLVVVSSIDEALKHASRYLIHAPRCEVFVIGGARVYEQFLPVADKLYLTLVDGEYEADTFFPDYSAFQNVVFKEEKKENGQKFTCIELVK